MRSDNEDLTARAHIRNAALQLFAEHGHDAVSVRQVGAEAGVSAALVLHHFGSKAGLREAVDRYAAQRIDDVMGQSTDATTVLADGSAASIAELFSQVFPPDSPMPAYVRRLLLSGDPSGVVLFSKWFGASRRILDEMEAAGLATPSKDPDVRAAFLLAADVALLVLREPLTGALGFDPMSHDGLVRWAQEVSAISREGIFTPPPPADPDATPREKPAPEQE